MENFMDFFGIPTILLCTNHFFLIFAPAIPREIGAARESAFFALFLSSELAKSLFFSWECKPCH